MAEKDPGGQGTGYSVPLGQKCPTGQMSLPGRPRLEDSTCIRKIQSGEKVLLEEDLAQCTTEAGAGKST